MLEARPAAERSISLAARCSLGSNQKKRARIAMQLNPLGGPWKGSHAIAGAYGESSAQAYRFRRPAQRGVGGLCPPHSGEAREEGATGVDGEAGNCGAQQRAREHPSRVYSSSFEI